MLDDTLTLDLGVPLTIPVSFDGGLGTDTLVGPTRRRDLGRDRARRGHGRRGRLQRGREPDRRARQPRHLRRSAPRGSCRGTVDGGSGGFDSLVFDVDGKTVHSTAVDPHSGSISVGGTPITYVGLEPISNTGTATDMVFDLGAGNDSDATLAPSGGSLVLSGSTFESTTFTAPTGSLTINGAAGRDKITISGIINLIGAALNVTAEDILVTGTVSTTGNVTLAAYDANAGNVAAPAVSASMFVDGSITAGGALSMSAETTQSVVLTSPTQTLNSNETYTFGSSAIAEVRNGAVVNAGTLRISAHTNSNFTYDGSAPADTAYNYVSVANGGSVNVSVTNLTKAGLTGGAVAIVGGGAISASDPDSVAIEATDDTNVNVHILDAADLASLTNLATAVADFLTYNRLTASTTMSRDTQAYVAQAPASGQTLATDGSVRIKAENKGAVALGVTSDFVGAASNTVTKDDAVASVAGSRMGVGALAVAARTGTTYGATAKDVTNAVTGSTRATVAGTTINATGSTSLDARDDSSLNALSANAIQIPGTRFVTVTSARARNDLNRTTEASITGSTVAAGGDLGVLATGNASAVATMRSISIREKSAFFHNATIPTASAKSLAATLAINVLEGGVDAHILNSTVQADDVTVAARTDQAVIDATAEIAASATTGADAVSFPLLTGNNTLAIGASLALNFIGWHMTSAALAGIDALLGTEFGATEAPWLIQGYIKDSTVTATGGLTVSADSAPLVNSTVSNTAASQNSGLFGVKSTAAGAILSSNKVSSAAKASIEFTTVARGNVSAGGDLVVAASDDAGIYSNAKLVVSSVTTNDGGVHFAQQALNSSVAADFATSQGLQAIAFGQRVRLSPGFGSPSKTAGTFGRQIATVTPGTAVVLDGRYGVARLTTASGIRLLAYGDLILLDEGYDGGGDPGVVYRYLGGNARRDLGGQDYSDDTLWTPVGGDPGGVYAFAGTAAEGVGIDLNAQDYSDTSLWTPLGGKVGSVYEYMGQNGTLNLATQDYTDLGYWKPVSETQLFPSGFNITQSPSTAIGGLVVLNDVRSQVVAYVKHATVTAASASITAVEQATIRASADSTASSSGGSSFTGQGTSLALNGVLTTNRVLSSANAYVEDSAVNVTGDFTVSASNLSQIDAITESASMSGANAMSFQLAFNTIGWLPTNALFAALDALIGDPLTQNGAFGGQQPAETVALVKNSDVTAGGAISLSALSAMILFALVGNSATSAPAALFGAGGMSVSGVLSSNMVASRVRSSAEGGSLHAGKASARTATAGELTPGDRVDVNGEIYEYVGEPRAPPPAIDLSDAAQHYATNSEWQKVDAISVVAADDAEITASTSMYGEVSPTNDAGAGILNGWAGSVLDDYQYTSKSGTKNLVFGDRVRLADDHYDAVVGPEVGELDGASQIVSLTSGAFVGLTDDYDGGQGNAGSIYRFLGATGSVDLGAENFNDPSRWVEVGGVYQWMGTAALGVGRNLGTEDYTDFEHWKRLSATTLITDSLSYAVLSEVGVALKKEGLTGGSNSYYGLIDHNDVRTTVEAYIQGTTVTAGDDVSVIARDAALISATEDSYVVPWDGVGGVIATNGILSSADAWIKNSDVTTTGDITVDAEHLAQIDASTTSRIEAWDAKSLVVAFNAIGWIPVNIFFSAADVLTGASDYLYDYTSNDRPATLSNGKLVRVDSGQFAGQVFRYIGSPLSGSIDLTPIFQNYGDATRWVNTSAQLPVLHDYTSTQTVASLARGKRVLVTTGGHSGRVFKYVGTATTTSTSLSPTDQDYSDINNWIDVTPVFGGQQPSHAQALVIDTPLNAGGNISVTATSGSQLNAIVGNDNVVEAALDLLLPGAQTTTKETNKKTGKVTKKVSGYGASGSAGGIVLASNKASSFARAAIEFTTGQGTVVAAGDINIVSRDSAGIDSHSSVIQDVVVTNDLTGIIPIVASLLPGDYKYTTASGTQNVKAGDRVRLGATYANGGTGGAGLPLRRQPGDDLHGRHLRGRRT